MDVPANVGEVQRRELERKYVIARKPLAGVDHPEDKLAYADAVQMYHPDLTVDEALTWLLDNTAYPFEPLQTVNHGLHGEWFASLDKTPYDQLLENMFPELDTSMRQQIIGSCWFEPGTEDVESILRSAAERAIQRGHGWGGRL